MSHEERAETPDEERFEELRSYIGIGPDDVRRVRSVRDIVLPHRTEIVDAFYQRILAHPGSREVLGGDEELIARLKESLDDWLEELLEARHDISYYAQRAAIGRVHVRVGLRQHYMVTATSCIRQHIHRVLVQELDGDLPEVEATCTAIDKVLDLDLAIMLGTYLRRRLLRSERLAALGEMAAAIAHEVRTPLASIRSALEVMRDDPGLVEERRPVIDEVVGQVDRLASVVTDLLSLARPVPIQIRPCTVRDLVDDARADVAADGRFEEVEVLLDDRTDGERLAVDPSRLLLAVKNLLRNAAEAMEGEGTIRVIARTLPGLRMHVAIEDEGPGIRPPERERVFEPFHTTRRRGTGLGLAIVRKIVDAHRGEIHVGDAPEDGGARLEMVLPVQPEDED